MPTDQLSVPVVLLLFNRPDTTAQVFNVLRDVQPSQLFVIADGPRAQNSRDIETCQAARDIAVSPTWQCKIQTNFSEVNLGTQERMASGLTWVFEQVEEAIILEDDCVPNPTFFPFCEALLARYRTDRRVMHIAGSNFQLGHQRTTDSYYYSIFPHVWGWATWRRAWQCYDKDLQSWPQFQMENRLHDWLVDRRSERYWHHDFNRLYKNEAKSWAVRWMFACWKHGGLSILPSMNLVENIGHGVDATNTVHPPWYAKLPTHSMRFPLKHPPFVMRDRTADLFTQRTIFRTNPLQVAEGRLWRAWRELRYKGGPP